MFYMQTKAAKLCDFFYYLATIWYDVSLFRPFDVSMTTKQVYRKFICCLFDDNFR